MAISGKYGKIGIPIPLAEQLDEEIERFRSWGGPKKMPAKGIGMPIFPYLPDIVAAHLPIKKEP